MHSEITSEEGWSLRLHFSPKIKEKVHASGQNSCYQELPFNLLGKRRATAVLRRGEMIVDRKILTMGVKKKSKT